MVNSVDILILSNGPGELSTWVRPVVKALRQQLGDDRSQVRISIVLSPCSNASGREAEIARSYPEVDRVQGAKDFFPFLLGGKTAEKWDWRDRGVVIFLGGDQIFPVVIGKRLGYRTVIYAEWDARWEAWVDRFAVMQPSVLDKANPRWRSKFTVVGDLMSEVGQGSTCAETKAPGEIWIGILPGSKPAKLMQGVPLFGTIADLVGVARSSVRFMIPVAPTLDLETLAQYADPDRNPISKLVQGTGATLVMEGTPRPYLKTAQGIRLELWTEGDDGPRTPHHGLLRQCDLCITTVGANTAELGALGVPMLVLLPTNQLDAMRSWDGLLGLLANLPGVGSLFAKLINRWMMGRVGLLAWPNIWAKREIVPELVGELTPQIGADRVLDYLDHPEKLAAMRSALQQVRGESGAGLKIAAIVTEELGQIH